MVELNCPHCGGGVDARLADQPQTACCPHCGEGFLIPAADGSVLPVAQLAAAAAFVIDDTEDHVAANARRQEELDGLRIRQVSAARRAAIRGRSYCLIGAIVLAVACGQLIWNTIRDVRATGWGVWPVGYLMAIACCAILANRLYRRGEQLRAEAAKSSLADPTSPPDLEKLSDGSQRWKNFEQMK